jgi:hypothetical protein
MAICKPCRDNKHQLCPEVKREQHAREKGRGRLPELVWLLLLTTGQMCYCAHYPHRLPGEAKMLQ